MHFSVLALRLERLKRTTKYVNQCRKCLGRDSNRYLSSSNEKHTTSANVLVSKVVRKWKRYSLGFRRSVDLPLWLSLHWDCIRASDKQVARRVEIVYMHFVSLNTCDTRATDIHVESSLLRPITVISPLVANEQQPVTWIPHHIEPIAVHLRHTGSRQRRGVFVTLTNNSDFPTGGK
jgi:hypothetical protein